MKTNFEFLKRHWLAVAILAVGLIALIAGFRTFSSYSNRVSPKVGPMVEAVYGIGTVTARHTYQLKLGVTDTLRKLYVAEGSSVKKGDLLVAFADGQGSRAPFAGLVTSLPYQEGETVFPQLPVLTLTDMTNPYVVVSLEQSAALRVKANQTASLSFETLRDQKLAGKVTSIYPKDGQFYVNIEVPEIPSEVLVGMTADVAIKVAEKENVLQIPLSAVNQGKVQVLRNGISKSLVVKLGATDGMWVEVADNSLTSGDTLLLPGKK
jgi:membrane fusion protein, macrolide-specific efflux system